MSFGLEAVPHLDNFILRKRSHIFNKLAGEGSLTTTIDTIPLHPYVPKTTTRALPNGALQYTPKSRTMLIQEPHV